MRSPDRRFTPQELAAFDGAEGRPAYVAHKGVVYDVTGSDLWKAGRHMNRHHAGADMGLALSQAPHPPEVLSRFPRVGILAGRPLAPASTTAGLPAWLSRAVRRFPTLKRHPHPMAVHFPIAFCLFAPVCLLLALLTGWPGFDATLAVLLGASVIFTPVAIVTGLFTWKLNYAMARMTPVLVKLAAAPALYACLVWAFVMRLRTPDLLAHPADHLGYLALVLGLFPLISLLGWCGAAITFPAHGDEETAEDSGIPSPSRLDRTGRLY